MRLVKGITLLFLVVFTYHGCRAMEGDKKPLDEEVSSKTLTLVPQYNEASSGSDKSITWQKLPSNLKAIIFSLLDTKDLKNCRLVNKELNTIAATKAIWHFLSLKWLNICTPRDIDNVVNVLKFKVRSLNLVDFEPNPLIYKYIGENVSLAELDLSQSSKTTNDCLYYLSGLKNLRKLTLKGLSINDVGVDYLKDFTQLEVLDERWSPEFGQYVKL